MRRLTYLLIAAMLPLFAIGAAYQVGSNLMAQEATPTAEGEIALRNVDGTVVGTASLSETSRGVTVKVTLSEGALEPGEHGIHIHETGICDPSGDEPFSSAGDHFNPHGATHGAPPEPMSGASPEGLPGATPDATPTATGDAHAGDLGNLTVEDDGSAVFEVTTPLVTMAVGQPTSLNDDDGSALVIHESPDDLQTDPDGEAGGRLLCGVIFSASGEDAEGIPVVAGTPDAAGSPAAEGEPQTGFVVEMDDFFYIPAQLTIPANTDVTIVLPNIGGTVHNFYIDELGVYTPNVDPDGETSVTINAEPGEYVYYCGIPGHRASGMVGTLIVE